MQRHIYYRALPLFLLVTLASVAHAPSTQAASGDDEYQVIVHPDNTVNELDRSFLRDAYLKKVSTWSSGETLRPVDLVKKFPARETFARQILKKSLAQLKQYWNQQIFSGKGVPPPEVASEAAMIAYVLANKGAIGYLPAGAAPGRAKVVKVK